MNFNNCSMSQDGILLNLEKGMDSELRARDLCKELLLYLEDGRYPKNLTLSPCIPTI